MGRIGTMELLLILGVVLLIFGPKKLPELAKGMGEAVREFKRGQKEFDETINEPVFPENQKTETKTTSNVETKDINDDRKVDR